MTVGDNAITGTLNYVTGYTEFSSNVEEQSGNFMALKMTADPSDAITTVEVINGTVGHPVTLDADMNIVLRIVNVDTESIRVVMSKNGFTMTKTYSLSGLVLAPAV